MPERGSAGATLIESALRRDRVATGVLMVVVPLVCWAWIVVLARDMYGPMTGASAWMMTPTWDLPHLLLLWAMWAVMMAGMMLPSAAPLLLLYAGVTRQRGRGAAAHDVYALAAGYLTVWGAFSFGATGVQRLLATSSVLSPMMEITSPRAGAVVLIIAGVYQWTPLKQTCLRRCRSPVDFLMGHWRAGTRGALEIGIRHGLHCVGCCWALMLLLFLGGVMNLAVIAGLTLFVAFEKLVPGGKRTTRLSGALLLGAAGWMLLG